MSISTLKPPPLSEVLKKRKAIRDVNLEHKEQITTMERMAIFISDHVGTPGFFFIVILCDDPLARLESAGTDEIRFDPAMGFVLWLFISNVLQIFLMPLIMVAQNLQDRHSELRAENDFDINVKAEREIEVILRHLEYQNTILLSLVQKMGVNVEEALASVEEKSKQTEKPAAEASTPK